MNYNTKIKQAFGGVKAPEDMADRIMNAVNASARPHKLSPKRRIALIAAAAIMALGLTTVGYAVVSRLAVDRAYTGGSTELVAVLDESEHGFFDPSDTFTFSPHDGPVLPYDDSENTVYTYDEAAALLGQDFSVPRIPDFSAKEFQLNTEPIMNRTAIYATFANDLDQTIFYFAEYARPDDANVIEWRVTGTIEQFEINGTAVYNQRDADGSWGRYIWQNGNLTYCLFYSPDYNLSDEEYEQIIATMLP